MARTQDGHLPQKGSGCAVLWGSQGPGESWASLGHAGTPPPRPRKAVVPGSRPVLSQFQTQGLLPAGSCLTAVSRTRFSPGDLVKSTFALASSACTKICFQKPWGKITSLLAPLLEPSMRCEGPTLCVLLPQKR